MGDALGLGEWELWAAGAQVMDSGAPRLVPQVPREEAPQGRRSAGALRGGESRPFNTVILWASTRGPLGSLNKEGHLSALHLYVLFSDLGVPAQLSL